MGTKHSKAAAYWALLLRVVSWLARINNGSRLLSRRDIGASVLQRPVAGCRPDYQRRAVKAVAIARPKPFPLDPEPKLEGEFCKIDTAGEVTELHGCAHYCGKSGRHRDPESDKLVGTFPNYAT